MIRRGAKIVVATILLCCGVCGRAYCEEVEQDYQYRFGTELEWTLVKGLKLSVAPELRYDSEFSLSRFQMEGELRYRTFGFLYWGASYRLVVEPQEWPEPAETSGRYGFSLMAREKVGRFTPSVTIKYSNYADDEVTDEAYLRYKAAVKYNIRKSRFTPYLGAEAFQQLDINKLYKMRYTAGVDYKVKKGQELYFEYKLDYFLLKYKNRNIFSVGYNFSF